MALTKLLILRKPRSGCLEERTALIPECLFLHTLSRWQAYFSISMISAARVASPLRFLT